MSEKDRKEIIDILLIKLFKEYKLILYKIIDFPQSGTYRV